MPSSVTVGSAAFLAAAGFGLVAVAANAQSDQAPSAAPAPDRPSRTSGSPSEAAPATAHTTHVDHKPGHRRHRHTTPRTLVEVYNNSGITGLAAETAGELQGAGWNVATTDNWYGEIPADTVYYGEGLRDQAKQLARTLHIDRIHPAVSPMSFDRLTVILTG